MRLFESLEFNDFLHSQRWSSEMYISVMSGVLDAFYDDERGLIGLCMYRIGGFCSTSFASYAIEFSAVTYLSLSVIIAIHNLSETFSKRFGGINICYSHLFTEKVVNITNTKTSSRSILIKFFLSIMLGFCREISKLFISLAG